MVGLDNIRTSQTNTRGVLGLEEAVGIIFVPRDHQRYIDTGKVHLGELLLFEPAEVALNAHVAFR
ncbi:hypothetical protein D3C81_2250410 [compost metagenome]